MTADQRDAYEERAAIMQFEGGLTRQQAERAAAEIEKRKAERAGK